MKSVICGLLAAVLVAPAWFSTSEQTPVTIIEIPVPTTTAPEPTSATTAPATTGTSPATTGTSPATTGTSPVTTSVAEPIPVLDTTEPESSTASGSDWIWRIVVAVALVALGVFSLAREHQALRGAARGLETQEMIAAVSKLPTTPTPVPRGFEAIEYQTGGTLRGAEVRSKSVAKYTGLEPAIEAARHARAEFEPDDSAADAWWVVWDLDTGRAAWIAEHDTPGERVIDLRHGRSVAAAKADSDVGPSE